MTVARAGLLVCALALAGGPLAAQAVAPAPSPRPDLEPLRVGGEVVIGAYAGLGGFLIGRYLGGALGDMLPHAAESTRDNFAHWTGLAVGGAATAGGVYAIGAIGNQRGSYGISVLGAGAGYLASLAVTSLIDRPSGPAVTPEKSRARWLQVTIGSLLPAIGATIAFNSTRRFK